MKRILPALGVLFLITSCSTTRITENPPTRSVQPSPTRSVQPSPTRLTQQLPTPSPKPSETPEPPPLFTVTFDGEECSCTTPETLPPGKYSFLFIDETDSGIELWLSRLEEGHTFQDLLDGQSEPGEYYPQPYWAPHPPKLADRWDDELGGLFYTFLLIEEGEYSQHIGRDDPLFLWFCSPFYINESPSE